MVSSRGDKKEDDFEVLDVRDTDDFVRSIRDWIGQGSNGKQLAIGGVSGWITGYLSMKIGKTIATAIGGSLILLQIANHKGYIKINWSKVNKDLEGATKKLAKSQSDESIPRMLDKAADYLDRQADKAGRMLKRKQKKWFGLGEKLDGSEAFYVGFLGGTFTGLLSAIVL